MTAADSRERQNWLQLLAAHQLDHVGRAWKQILLSHVEVSNGVVSLDGIEDVPRAGLTQTLVPTMIQAPQSIVEWESCGELRSAGIAKAIVTKCQHLQGFVAGESVCSTCRSLIVDEIVRKIQKTKRLMALHCRGHVNATPGVHGQAEGAQVKASAENRCQRLRACISTLLLTRTKLCMALLSGSNSASRSAPPTPIPRLANDTVGGSVAILKLCHQNVQTICQRLAHFYIHCVTTAQNCVQKVIELSCADRGRISKLDFLQST